jgi:hypothetical protein
MTDTALDPILASIINAYNDLQTLTHQDERLRAHIHLFDACKNLRDSVQLGVHWHPCDINHDTRPAGHANDVGKNL